MSWDMPAAGYALWKLYDATGIRPEWALAAMNAESGLHTTAVNSAGCQGLFQWCSAPLDFSTWSASQQIIGGAIPFWRSLVQKFGPIRSGAQLEQGNFYPASLGYAHDPADVVVSSKSDYAAWEGNRAAFDPNNTGYITVGGVGDFVSRQLDANRDFFDSILSQTYALRPNESPTDPVWGYGTSSSAPRWSGPMKVALIGALAALAGIVVWYWPEEQRLLKRLA
jgi:hypothetical protein